MLCLFSPNYSQTSIYLNLVVQHIHSPKKETPRLFDLNFKNWGVTFFDQCSSLLSLRTPSRHFKICK